MQNFDIYNDIAKRTNGDIYIGVVGPVRTGKSTFIKRFMELLVLDKIDDANKKARAIDELPQSADGKTIMTTEPKFVPNEAIKLSVGDNINANVRLIDCVGYLVADALGHKEGKKQRLVRTPWSEKDLPFQEAAELGTEKVIKEHSTIGIVVTTDGTITDISRDKYIDAEERVIRELKELGKPFVVLVNSKNPADNGAVKLAESLSVRHGVPALAVNAQEISKEELEKIMTSILLEFPLRRIDIDIPKWMRSLPADNGMISEIIKNIMDSVAEVTKMADYKKLSDLFTESSILNPDAEIEVDASEGVVRMSYTAVDGLYFKELSKMCGDDVDDDFKLMSYVKNLSKSYNDYESIRKAMDEVKETGYGIVNPLLKDMQLADPEVIRSGTQYGIKLKASAPSLHIVRVDVETELKPLIGSEQQSADLVKSFVEGESKQDIWNTNMFGKPLNSLVQEDMNSKISMMPVDTQRKLRKTMGRIVNEGRGGVLCILL